VYVMGRPPTAGLGEAETDVVVAVVPDVMYRCCTALGPTPLLAVTTAVKDRPAVFADGVPKNTRAPKLVARYWMPGGRAPDKLGRRGRACGRYLEDAVAPGRKLPIFGGRDPWGRPRRRLSGGGRAG
jgi:hypothetical protein